MLRSISRALQCRQVYLHLINFAVNGVGVPAASGLDAGFVDSVVDNGVGDYTITFKDIAQRDIAVAGIHSATDGLYARVSVVSTNSVRVLMKDFAGVATDGAFNISLFWHGSKHLY